MTRLGIIDRLQAGDVLIMDGATGSELQRRGVDPRAWRDLGRTRTSPAGHKAAEPFLDSAEPSPADRPAGGST